MLWENSLRLRFLTQVLRLTTQRAPRICSSNSVMGTLGREKAKETLGVDLSPRLIGILFRQIHAVLSDFFDTATGYVKTSDHYTVFVEQSIGVATIVLQRLDEVKASSSTSNPSRRY